MKIIVTGGAGFIGGNFVHYMLEKHPEDRIVCLDALTYAGNLETLADVMENKSFKFVKGNICDRKKVYEVFEAEKPDVLVNFAAESHVDRSIDTPEIFLQTNILGTSVLLDACRKYGIDRFHQVSTDEVYGDLPLDRPDLFFTETTNLHTSSPYSASKASGRTAVSVWAAPIGSARMRLWRLTARSACWRLTARPRCCCALPMPCGPVLRNVWQLCGPAGAG